MARAGGFQYEPGGLTAPTCSLDELSYLQQVLIMLTKGELGLQQATQAIRQLYCRRDQ